MKATDTIVWYNTASGQCRWRWENENTKIWARLRFYWQLAEASMNLCRTKGCYPGVFCFLGRFSDEETLTFVASHRSPWWKIWAALGLFFLSHLFVQWCIRCLQILEIRKLQFPTFATVFKYPTLAKVRDSEDLNLEPSSLPSYLSTLIVTSSPKISYPPFAVHIKSPNFGKRGEITVFSHFFVSRRDHGNLLMLSHDH